jgi:hypothetical protein
MEKSQKGSNLNHIWKVPPIQSEELAPNLEYFLHKFGLRALISDLSGMGNRVKWIHPFGAEEIEMNENMNTSRWENK